MKWLNGIISIQELAKKIGVMVSCATIVLMMAFIFLDVLLRNLMNYSIPGGYEYVQNYFMPFAVFPVLAYVYSSGVLPRLDLLVIKFSKSRQYLIRLTMRILEFVIFSLFFYYALKGAISGTMEGEAFPAGGKLFPIYPSYIVAAIGIFMLTVETLLIIVQEIITKEQKEGTVTDFID